jgi:hypothetical protein
MPRPALSCFSVIKNKPFPPLFSAQSSPTFCFSCVSAPPKPEREAIAQLQSKCYADKYRATDVTITLVGIEFSRDARNLVRFETAEA